MTLLPAGAPSSVGGHLTDSLCAAGAPFDLAQGRLSALQEGGPAFAEASAR